MTTREAEVSFAARKWCVQVAWHLGGSTVGLQVWVSITPNSIVVQYLSKQMRCDALNSWSVLLHRVFSQVHHVHVQLPDKSLPRDRIGDNLL
eukprot:1183779-Amphidinium_carterae.1